MIPKPYPRPRTLNPNPEFRASWELKASPSLIKIPGDAVDVKNSASDVKEPASNVEKSASDVKKPASDSKKPASDVKKPASDVKKPASDVKNVTNAGASLAEIPGALNESGASNASQVKHYCCAQESTITEVNRGSTSLSTFVSVGSALTAVESRIKGNSSNS